MDKDNPNPSTGELRKVFSANDGPSRAQNIEKGFLFELKTKSEETLVVKDAVEKESPSGSAGLRDAYNEKDSQALLLENNEATIGISKKSSERIVYPDKKETISESALANVSQMLDNWPRHEELDTDNVETLYDLPDVKCSLQNSKESTFYKDNDRGQNKNTLDDASLKSPTTDKLPTPVGEFEEHRKIYHSSVNEEIIDYRQFIEKNIRSDQVELTRKPLLDKTFETNPEQSNQGGVSLKNLKNLANESVNIRKIEKVIKFISNLLLLVGHPNIVPSLKSKITSSLISSDLKGSINESFSALFHSASKLLKPYSAEMQSAKDLEGILKNLGDLALEKKTDEFYEIIDHFPSHINDIKELEDIKNIIESAKQQNPHLTDFNKKVPGLHNEKEIKELRKNQEQILEVEKIFYEDLYDLNYKWHRRCQMLFKRRKTIIEGYDRPLPATNDTESTEVQKKSGVPGFWFTIFQKVNILRNIMEEWDEPILKGLSNIKVVMRKPDKKGFILNFYFKPNDYFDDPILRKGYEMDNLINHHNPLLYDGPEITNCTGCKIHWKPNQNVTLRTSAKTKKKYSRNSFFHFFTPPAVDKVMHINDDTYQVLLDHYQIGNLLREKIVPYAIKFYTGEAFNGDFINAGLKRKLFTSNKKHR